jgi:glycine/D-amino acid oxidase-like deaminating enzyme
VDVAVVGGGIAGLQAAYALVREGLQVALVESGRIIEDITGYTTGKLTSQHGLIYQHLIDSLGPQKAQIYADANQSAIGKIAGFIEENAVDCDFQLTASYLFCEQEENLALIKAEAKAAKRLGLPAAFVEETPLYYAYGAVRFDDQARWHPRKYLMFLAGEIAVAGGYILESTRAMDIAEEGKKLLIKTGKGALRARSVVIATNTPFYHREIFAPLLSPTRSYVLGVRLADEVPDGLFYSVDGTGASMRSQPVGEDMIFMVGGWDKNLQVFETEKQYQLVESYAEERFNIASIDYHWFTQDQKTPDRLPLVGLLPGSKNIYVASGFNGWGMTTSFVAANVLTDLIAGRHNPAASLFLPDRLIK